LINGSETEQKIAKSDSSEVNNAYETLNDPLKRAIYFLKINNIFIDSIKLDNMLLTEIKEEIEDGNEERVNLIKKELEKRRTNLYHEIIELTSVDDIDKAVNKVILLKYLSNL
jgi:Fe-S protein assembly co-chaperone HscB